MIKTKTLPPDKRVLKLAADKAGASITKPASDFSFKLTDRLKSFKLLWKAIPKETSPKA